MLFTVLWYELTPNSVRHGLKVTGKADLSQSFAPASVSALLLSVRPGLGCVGAAVLQRGHRATSAEEIAVRLMANSGLQFSLWLIQEVDSLWLKNWGLWWWRASEGKQQSEFVSANHHSSTASLRTSRPPRELLAYSWAP